MTDDRFNKLLKSNRHLLTRERKILFSYLRKAGSPLSIQELIHLTADELDPATVYRNLDLFEKLGITHRINSGWKYKVELSDLFKEHHHHMTCENCSKVIEFHEPRSFEAELTRIAQRNGFDITNHTLELRGLCIDCC